MPTALMGGDGGEADKEPVMQHVDGKADGARMVRIEAIEQEITALGEDDKKRAARDDGRLDKIGGGDAEHIAEQDMVEVLIGLDLGEQHEPEAEHARKHDAHDRVLFYAAVVFQVARKKRAREARRERANRERNAEDEGDDDARQDGVRNGIAHERPAFQDQIAGQHGANRTNQQRHAERALHEVVGKRLGEEADRVHQAASATEALFDSARARCLATRALRRAASTPCFGAR